MLLHLGTRRVVVAAVAAVLATFFLSALLRSRTSKKLTLFSDLASADNQPASQHVYDLEAQTGQDVKTWLYPTQNPQEFHEIEPRPQQAVQREQKHKGPRRKAAVFATIQGRDRNWMRKITSDWEVSDYVTDDPESKYKVPYTGGREAMVYLTYIIDNYNDLPDIIVFGHGHDRAWHQPESFTYILSALNLDVVEKHGWVNLRCTLNPSCIPAPETWVKTTWAPPGEHWWSYIVRGLFSHVYRPGDPWYNDTIPEIEGLRIPPLFGSPCCAQFAVSKAAVIQKPLGFWKRVREPIMDEPGRLNPKWWPGAIQEQGQGITDWKIGVAYERLWHYFFGMEPITCLDEDYCRNVIYQGRIRCNGQTSNWEESQNFSWISCELKQSSDTTR